MDQGLLGQLLFLAGVGELVLEALAEHGVANAAHEQLAVEQRSG